MNLLTFHNPKTQKGEKAGYSTAVLHLSPSTSAGIRTRAGVLFDACPSAGRCVRPCLNYAGRGGIGNAASNVVQLARRARTQLFVESPDRFYELLYLEITRAIKRATKQGRTLAIRPNGTSDIPAIGRWVAEQFPHTQVYDYTKIPKPWRRVRSNYHITFSWEGTNWDECKAALDHNINVAVPYFGAMPEEFRGYPVIDGDTSDLRFTDPNPVVVGLAAKGRAKQDKSGFVVR